MSSTPTRIPSESDREAALQAALEKIERWFGEFPETGQFWDEECTRPISYGANYGSNGERDFMRAVARKALATPSPAAAGGVAEGYVVVPRALLVQTVSSMRGVSVFLRTKEKIKHPEGEDWWNERIDNIVAVLAASTPPEDRGAGLAYLEGLAALDVEIEALTETAAKVRAGSQGDKVAAWIEMSVRGLKEARRLVCAQSAPERLACAPPSETVAPEGGNE